MVWFVSDCCLLTSYVCSVAQTVLRVIIRDRRVVAIVVVTDEIVPIRNQAALAKTTAESRVGIVNTGVDDAHPHALTGVPQGTQLVHLGHNMGGEGIRGRAIVILPSLWASCCRIGSRTTSHGNHPVFGQSISTQRPDLFDRCHGSDVLDGFILRGGITELERCASEQRVSQVHAGRKCNTGRAKTIVKRVTVLVWFVRNSMVSSQLESAGLTWLSSNSTIYPPGTKVEFLVEALVLAAETAAQNKPPTKGATVKNERMAKPAAI